MKKQVTFYIFFTKNDFDRTAGGSIARASVNRERFYFRLKMSKITLSSIIVVLFGSKEYFLRVPFHFGKEILGPLDWAFEKHRFL